MEQAEKAMSLADELRAHAAEQGAGDYRKMLLRIVAVLDDQKRQIEEKDRALADLFELVEMSEMSCRDLPPHEYEAIEESAIKAARAALRSGGAA